MKAAVPSKTFRLTDPVDSAREQAEDFATTLLAELSDERIAALRNNALTAVDKIKCESKRRESFDGKRVLDEFYKRHLHSTGMSKEIFIYGCAREASKRKSVVKFVDTLFQALDISDSLAAC